MMFYLVVKEYTYSSEMVVWVGRTEVEAKKVLGVLEKQRADGCYAIVAVELPE